VACRIGATPALPQTLSVEQKTYLSATQVGDTMAFEEVYVFATEADAQTALRTLEDMYTPDTCQAPIGGMTHTIRQTASLGGATPGAAYLREFRTPGGGMPRIVNDAGDNHEFLARSGAVVGYLRIMTGDTAVEGTDGDPEVLRGLAAHLAAYAKS
jgi:hypothetical protein